MNFLGWFLTVYLFQQAFALYLAARASAPVTTQPPVYWYQACVMFAVMGLDFPAGYFGGANVAITDATGRTWQTGDIYETSAIVSLYTMLFVAAMCAIILHRRGWET